MNKNSDGTIESMEDIEISIFRLYRRERSQGLRSRDHLPHTRAFNRLVKEFNKENGLSYSHHVVWEHLISTLKAGKEKHIEDYLTSRNIQFEEKS